MEDLQNIIAQKESIWLDFKREFHSNNAKLLHDILCLSNALYNGDRFIVFGVADDKIIYGVENDPNRKTNADVHDFLRQMHFNKIPQVELTFHKLSGHEIGLLQIENLPQKPYAIQQDFQRNKILIRAGVVYTRLSDTNIPHNETAPEDYIERMWKERLEYKQIKSLSFEETFPIRLDDTMERVLEVLGEPNASGYRIAHYYSEGIEVSYDQHDDFVDGLSIYHLPSGTAFEGTLFGIKLGDSFAKVKENLGNPSYWGLTYEKSSIALWEIDDKLLFVTIWSNKKRDDSIPFQQLGTVRSISYCNQKSFIGYNVLVARAIEQIARGDIPKEFEQEDISIRGVSLDSPIFRKEYELLGARPAFSGGAEVLVGFRESKEVIAFWVYPLQWTYPVIRAIYKIGDDIDESETSPALFRES